MNWLNKKVASLIYLDLSYAFLSYGIDTVLIVYLIKILGLSDFEALSSLSVKSCLVYSLPVLTAFISNHWLTKEMITSLGLLIMSLGLILLSISNQTYITFSLSCLTVGYVLGRPIISILLGKVVPTKENADVIRIFHVLSNVAYLLAPLVFSLSLYGEKSLFLSLGIGGLGISFVFFWKFFYKDIIKSWYHFGIGILIVIGFILIVDWFLNNPNYLKYIFFMALIICVFYSFQLFRDKKQEDLLQLKQFFLLIICAVLFFIFFSQQFFFMPLFLEKYVNFQVGTFKVPTPWFNMINPFIGIIAFPFLIHLTKSLKDPSFVIPSIFLLTSSAFVILFIGILFPSSLIITIILAYSALTIADLIFVPLILSKISTWQYETEKSKLMGFLYLSMACSRIIAPNLALWINFPTHFSSSITENPYAIPFLIIGLGLLGIAMGIKLVFRYMKKISKIELEKNKK